MSKYNDVNQLLEEISTSARSASDPWTITHGYQSTVKRDSFSPAVVADLGGSTQELTAGIQSSEQIARADATALNPAATAGNGSSQSTVTGFLGSLLNLFPAASMLGKLFGLGGGSSPAPLAPYVAPPPISFQGAMSAESGSLMGSGGEAGRSSPAITSNLSYGANGLPRSAGEEVSNLVNSSESQQEANAPRDLSGQLSSLTQATFASQPASEIPVIGTDLLATASRQGSGAGSSGLSSESNAGASLSAGTGSAGSQQGQNILVQVQAMDSQSFMDHSHDIAQAVRQAMLNLHSVNDVISDL